MAHLLAMKVRTHLLLFLFKSSLMSSSSEVALSSLFIKHVAHSSNEHSRVLITVFQRFFYIKDEGVALKVIAFFFGVSLSSLTLIFISWVLRFPMKPEKSISSLSLSSLRVVALTFQDLGRALMTFQIFWSLSILSPREDKALVILVKRVSISSIVSFSSV